MKGKSKIQLALWALCAVLFAAVVSIGNLPVKVSYANDCLPCEGDFNCDRDVDGSDLAIFAADFGRTDCCGCQIGVPKTGQTTPSATGDDGDLQMGIPWPDPRFTDNEDGTVTDNLTGLIWLKKANCFEARIWTDALSDCNGLASGACGLTDGSAAGEWRLPNVRELHSLIHYGFWSPPLPNTAGTGQWSEDDPFTGVLPYLYWSSTTPAYEPGAAWLVGMSYGDVFKLGKGYYEQVWCVRAGQ